MLSRAIKELPVLAAPAPEEAEARLGQLPVVHALGRMLFDPCWAERFHIDEHAELLHVQRGEIHLETRDTRITASPGEVLILPAGIEHRDVFDTEEGLEAFLVQFNWPGFQELSAFLKGSWRPELSQYGRQEIAGMLGTLERDLAGSAPPDQLLVRSRLLTVLLCLLRDLRHHGQHPPSSAVRRRSREIMLAARAYLDRHYQEPVSLEAIADALHVSPYHLSHVFSQESDFSLFTYLTSLRMERARALLSEGTMKIGEVAERVGFESSSYFSKVFRRHFGIAPSECLGEMPTKPH